MKNNPLDAPYSHAKNELLWHINKNYIILVLNISF